MSSQDKCKVVDARAGPGTKPTLKNKKYLSPTKHKYKSKLKRRRRVPFIPWPMLASKDLAGSDGINKRDLISKNIADNKKKASDLQISSNVDPTYWKITKICCGIIFKGMCGEVMVDVNLFKPCKPCLKEKSPVKDKLQSSQSLEDAKNTASGSNSTSAEVDVYSVSNQSTTDTPLPEKDVKREHMTVQLSS